MAVRLGAEEWAITDPAQPSRVPKFIAVVAIAASVGVCYFLYYATQVCDDQVTESGELVEVCRHLTITDPPIVFVGLVALLALTTFFNEISGFGVTLKKEVKQALASSEAAAKTSQEAKLAVHATRAVSETAEQVALQAARSMTPTELAPGTVSQLETLAANYDETRAAMPQGDARTSLLTSIMSQMIAAASTEPDGSDARLRITSRSDGTRLAGYAYVYAHLDLSYAPDLVGAVTSEPTAFGQYWAIRALRGLVRRDPTVLTAEARRDLTETLQRLSPNQDRAYELRGLLSEAFN